jgi:hypothetical protein
MIAKPHGRRPAAWLEYWHRRIRYGRPVSFRLQQRVVDEFAVWAAEVEIGPDGEQAGGQWQTRIAILLQGRATYLNRPDPTRWRSGDVHDLFMTYVAPRQVDAWDLAAHGLDAIRGFLRFLDATDRLHPASTRVATLLKELDRLAPKYAAAMADTSRWRLAKRVFTAILADGIELDAGPAVLEAWAQRFNARDIEGRRAVLGELIDHHPGYATGRLLIHDGQVAMLAAGAPLVKHLVWPDLGCDCGCEQPAQFPPVALPDPATLAKLVATDGADLLRQLAALAAWAGDEGKTVDGRGEPRKADRPAVLAALGLPVDHGQAGGRPALTRLWRLAIEFDVIQLRRTRVVPGTGADLLADALAGDGAADQALDLWSAIADALIHPPTPGTMPKGGEHLQDWLRPWMPRFLGLLYAVTANGEPAALDAITEQLLDEYHHRLPPGDPGLFAGLAAAAVRNALADLAAHGAVIVTGTNPDLDPHQAAAAAALGTASWALYPQPGLSVELTDLGRYLIRQRLLTENAHAPLAA